jgi:hypothetical protein
MASNREIKISANMAVSGRIFRPKVQTQGDSCSYNGELVKLNGR